MAHILKRFSQVETNNCLSDDNLNLDIKLKKTGEKFQHDSRNNNLYEMKCLFLTANRTDSNQFPRYEDRARETSGLIK